MKRSALLIPILSCLFFIPAEAQVVPKADVTVAFDLSQSGHRFSPTWGVDVAWISEQNVRKGINHMGKENIGIGRSAFRFKNALTNDSVLPSATISTLRQRSNLLNIVSPTLPIVLTADQEAGADPYFVVNKVCDVPHWTANIVSHVHWMEANTRHPIIGVSPYNEPDYWTNEEGATVARQVEVARRLRENYPRMDTISIVGGNTLNNDKALQWYTSGKQYYDWGNTHQLAGSFTTFANFFQQMVKDGKVGYADEMHNVGEAMIGLEYGMTVGVWWGFDSRARGEFCDISRHGERMAYGEHRDNWTAASVYRHDDGRVKAFIGSSERQAATTSYQFLSLDRDVYFDGYGPVRQYRMEIPGGNGYQQGQSNAERVIDITWGDDVQPMPITEGTYKLVNKATGTVMATAGGNIIMQRWTGAKTQQWNIAPVSPRIGGDYSFFEFTSASNARLRPNVKNYSTNDGAEIIAYAQDKPSSNEQWYFKYAGNGYYYVLNRETALYLSTQNSSPNNNVKVIQKQMQTTQETIDRLLWRLLPADIDYDTDAPAIPVGLSATYLDADAVLLNWERGTEQDLDGYMVLRYDQENDQWNTIARRVMPPFVDNGLQPLDIRMGREETRYKIKAIDRAQNLSEPSEVVSIRPQSSNIKSLVAHLPLNDSFSDISLAQRHASAAIADAVFEEGHEKGAEALRFRNGQYLQLPNSVVRGDEFSIGFWVMPTVSTAWQRLFDFGYDTTHYFFLATNNGSNKMRFAIRNGGNEQTLDAPTLAPLQWKHVTVTIRPGHTSIYIDGKLAVETAGITISPADVHPVLCYLGRSQFNADPLYTGYMQDVCIYNYALTPDEVAQLYGGTLGIDTPQSPDLKPQIFNLGGVRLNTPQHGLNIIGNKKIMIE